MDTAKARTVDEVEDQLKIKLCTTLCARYIDTITITMVTKNSFGFQQILCWFRRINMTLDRFLFHSYGVYCVHIFYTRSIYIFIAMHRCKSIVYTMINTKTIRVCTHRNRRIFFKQDKPSFTIIRSTMTLWKVKVWLGFIKETRENNIGMLAFSLIRLWISIHI